MTVYSIAIMLIIGFIGFLLGYLFRVSHETHNRYITYLVIMVSTVIVIFLFMIKSVIANEKDIEEQIPEDETATRQLYTLETGRRYDITVPMYS